MSYAKTWRDGRWLGAMAAVAILATAPAFAQARDQDMTLFPGQRVLPSGDRLDYDSGILLVPEHHDRPDGPKIAISFQRYRARHPSGAAPIFILAGGPGDSALDRLERARRAREDLQFFSEFADVIEFDQRGAGRSLPEMSCPGSVQLPLDKPSNATERMAAMRQLATACKAYWTRRGVDLSAYTTPESGEDVVQLAKALGYERISLYGGSYGSHLGLWLIRRHAAMLDRVVLRGIEGPDDTYDVPSQTLDALSRIAAAAEQSPELAGKIPPGGLIAALRTVEQRLAAKPVTVEVKGKAITLGVDDVRLAAKHDANRSGGWPAFIIRMYQGNYSQLARIALHRRTIDLEGPMHFMMDCASGISPERKKQILDDPAQSVLGDINEDYFATCDVWNAPDLGAAFRSFVHADLPMLVFQGTWDVSTPMQNAQSNLKTLTGTSFAQVIGGTHPATDELFDNWAPMRATIRQFYKGGKVTLPAEIVLPKVTFERPDE